MNSTKKLGLFALTLAVSSATWAGPADVNLDITITTTASKISVVEAYGKAVWGLVEGGVTNTVSNIGGVMIRGGTVRGRINIDTNAREVSHAGGTLNLGGVMVQ